ncbi:adenylyl-sulfate kinase [Cellulomonas sp. JZ18]|uniref:adenylyl-sulfate kinase n=1 Tax=Cellulomonas sp. JZ18 TaxID=2654191 RepID=UPI0012D4249D|nr:adenylyl-sulfate kinase [Cellulomonas sp. JZ18]QGQ18357.1 adenylyl-sulfate kinase [Cellulomonas sp. JZ18]
MGPTVGMTIWLTGVSAAGKTTLGRALRDTLVRSGVPRVELLDGDDVRPVLSAELGFGDGDRDTHVRRVGWLACLLARHGVVTVVAVIAPGEASRQAVVDMHRADGTPCYLVHVDAPQEVRVQRDPKGLYARAREGSLTNLTGLDGRYEVPRDPHLRVRTDRMTPSAAVAAVLGSIPELARLSRPHPAAAP